MTAHRFSRPALTGLAVGGLLTLLLVPVFAQRQARRVPPASDALTVILGRPTDRSIVVSVLAPSAIETHVAYGLSAASLAERTPAVTVAARTPTEVPIEGLSPDTRYFYRVRHRRPGTETFTDEAVQTFVTARAEGRTFMFGVQGDSHPERDQRMFDAELYRRTLDLVAEARPDFYFMMGDDFSIERLISARTYTQDSVDAVYALQRPFLARMAGSTPLFLVNGNHEQAARALADGSATNPAVLAARARARFFPLPAPDTFYSGNATPEPHVGLLRDYYAWTWGDALFVVLDPYWHSSVIVDNEPGGTGGQRTRTAGRARNLWDVTLGDAQYQWLRRTLETSTARHKFVFAHHVMGTGRGGVEAADGYEWGGRDPRGSASFATRRPTWPWPIHDLMVRTGVSVFFQGHDHLFARQEKDGVVYQTVPNPADLTYTAFNRDAYRSGDVLPNAGHLQVTVSPAAVRVAYVRSFLPKDSSPTQRHGSVAFAYDVTPRRSRTATR